MRPVSIQIKLILIFLVAAVLPIVLVGLLSYTNSLKAVEKMVGNRTDRIAQAVESELDQKLRDRLGDQILLENKPTQDFLAKESEGTSADEVSSFLEFQNYAGNLFKEYNRYYQGMILVNDSGEPVFRLGTKGLDRLAPPAPPGALSAEAMEEAETQASRAQGIIDSLNEIPLPGAHRKQVEDFGRSLQDQLREKVEETRREVETQEEDSAMEKKLLAAVLEALASRSVNDPAFGGPTDPADPILGGQGSTLLRYHSGGYTDADKTAARTAIRLARDENVVLIHRIEGTGEADAVRLVRPIFSTRDENRRLGALILDLRLDYLFPDDLSTQRFGAKGALAVVNLHEGEILYHTNPYLIGENIRLAQPKLADAIREKSSDDLQENSWFRFEEEDGARLASVIDVGTVPWAVVATAFPREFESEARAAGLINLTIATLAVLLALGVLSFSSRRISTSIHKVTAGAREIAAGNLDHTIHVDTHDEIETLADAFNSMTVALRENISLREKGAEELAALNRTLEDRVQERTQELVGLNEALNQANQELKELDRLKSNFLATVSHEFRTPLTSITAFSEILLDEMGETEASREVLRFLGIINAESERLGRLIKNLLDLSRIEAGRMRWDRSRFPVREVLVAALDGLLPVLGEKDIRIIREINCPEAEVLADRDRIQQVVSNLIENAVKFSSKGKRIWVGCRLVESSNNGGPWLEICVRDEGPGIPETHLEKIFERFQQVDSTDTRGTGGSGLGLAISKEIVEHHEGRIWAVSEAGKGASFHFTLPVYSGEGEQHPAAGKTGKETEHA